MKKFCFHSDFSIVVLWLISRTLPILQQHVWSFKVSINIGMIIITGLLVLGAVLLIHKYQEKANKREKERKAEITDYVQKVVELKEQLTEKEKLIDQFYKDQKANSKIMNSLTGEVNQLRDELREQEALVSAHNYLFERHGIKIISARFGIHPQAATTKDVTKQIVFGLREQGNIPLTLNLVGGKENDPEEGQSKKTYIECIYCARGRQFSKKFDERHILSIEDLQDVEGN